MSLYSVIMIERINENGQFYRDLNFYKGSLSAFFLMNKHRKDSRFCSIVNQSGKEIRREALLYGTVDLVDSMFPIRYPLYLNDNKILYNNIPHVGKNKKQITRQRIEHIQKSKNIKVENLQPRRKFIYSRDGYKCVICGEDRIHLLSLDHILPKSKGGSSDIKNLQTMCRNCNGEKGDQIITNEELKIRRKITNL